MIFKNTFAKLFEFKRHQLLVTKEYVEGSEEGKDFQIRQRIEFERFNIDISIMAKTEEQRDEVFDNYDHKQAKYFMDMALEAADKMYEAMKEAEENSEKAIEEEE